MMTCHESFWMPFNVDAYLLGHFAVRQTELRFAIRPNHPLLLYYNKRANIIHDV